MTTNTKNPIILGLLSGYVLIFISNAIEISPAWVHSTVTIVYGIVLLAAVSHARNRDARGPVPLSWTVAIVPAAGLIPFLLIPGPGSVISAFIVLTVVLVVTVAEIGTLARYHAAKSVLPPREPGDWEGVLIGQAIEVIKPGELVSLVIRDGKRFVQRARAEDVTAQ